MVGLAERKLRVDRPRLRRKDGRPGAVVEPSAYAAMQRDCPLGRRMPEILTQGVSTWNCRTVLPEMAGTEKQFRRIMGREQLWMLTSCRDQDAAAVAADRKIG